MGFSLRSIGQQCIVKCSNKHLLQQRLYLMSVGIQIMIGNRLNLLEASLSSTIASLKATEELRLNEEQDESDCSKIISSQIEHYSQVQSPWLAYPLHSYSYSSAQNRIAAYSRAVRDNKPAMVNSYNCIDSCCMGLSSWEKLERLC